MIPEDSRVEIDAKIHAGYCKLPPSKAIADYIKLISGTVTTGKVMTTEELQQVQGRGWEE